MHRAAILSIIFLATAFVVDQSGAPCVRRTVVRLIRWAATRGLGILHAPGLHPDKDVKLTGLPKKFYSADRRWLYRDGPLVLTKNTYPTLKRMKDDFLVSSEDLDRHVLDMFPEGLSIHGWFYAALSARYRDLMHPDAAQEIVFEYVRRAAFPHMPSRFQCFFAFDDLDRVKAFAAATSPVYRVVELRAEKFVRLDMNWVIIPKQTAGLSYVAHQYWSGAATGKPDWEYLLVPPVDVIEIPTST